MRAGGDACSYCDAAAETDVLWTHWTWEWLDVVLAVGWIRDWWRTGFPLWDEPRDVVDGKLVETGIWTLEGIK